MTKRPNAGWARHSGPRREMSPLERLRADTERYADAVLWSLGAEWLADASVREVRSVPSSRVARILRRSSADSLASAVLAHLAREGWVTLDSGIVYFTPALIDRWRMEGLDPSTASAPASRKDD